MKRREHNYRKCRILPVTGGHTYFGSKWETRVMYRTRWWRIFFPDLTWVHAGTLEDARDYIDRVGYRHGGEHSQS